jgi:hypothetical protein
MVRYHRHVTGTFRGGRHTMIVTSITYTRSFHNLRGYDSHVIMQAIGRIQGKSLKCIPNNMGKSISFSLGCMDFIDSFQFMSGPTQVHHMTAYFGTEKKDLLLRKQIYPYE